METVSHDGRETAYRLGRPEADGATVLYVHGSGGMHRVWAAQYGPEGPSHPAAALDLSGHGASADAAVESGPETLSAYVEDVLAVQRAVDADVLVGNSLGGAVVQRLLLEYDHDLSGVVLAGTGAELPVHEQLRTWLATDFERAIGFLHGENRLFHDADPRTAERSRETMRAVGRRITERDFLACHSFDVRDRVGAFDLPVLAVVGEYDRLTPKASHEFIAENAPDARLAVVEEAAHLAMVERPEAFTRELGAFVADVC